MADSRGIPLIRSPRSARGARIGGSQQRLPPQLSDGPVIAVRIPVTRRADRDRSKRAGYLATSQHQMLRHLGDIRRQRTRSATEVQGNSLKLSRPRSPSPSAARAAVNDLARRLNPGGGGILFAGQLVAGSAQPGRAPAQGRYPRRRLGVQRCGGHRAGIGSSIPGRYPRQGLRAATTARLAGLTIKDQQSDAERAVVTVFRS